MATLTQSANRTPIFACRAQGQCRTSDAPRSRPLRAPSAVWGRRQRRALRSRYRRVLDGRWAADGFPIYCLFGYTEARDPQSGIRKLTSSYRLKEGTRPNGELGPGGRYDGAFVQDYAYVEGSGDLDECNGRICVTPEFPEGTYAYFLSEAWPVIPRGFRGTPVSLKRPPQGPPGRGRRPPYPGRQPPQRR